MKRLFKSIFFSIIFSIIIIDLAFYLQNYNFLLGNCNNPVNMDPIIIKIKGEDCSISGKYHSKLNSPLYIEDSVYCVAQNGDILKFNQKGEHQIVFTILGQPSALAYKQAEQYFLIADFAHQSIFSREDAQSQQITNLIAEYKNHSFLGPNSIKIGPFSKNMYFTDSGPFQQTSIQNKEGSVFVYKFQNQQLHCLTFRKLAYPSGLQLDQQEKYLLVSETGQNRILKFNIEENLAGLSTIFYQFSGRYGPTSICAAQGSFYIALYEFEQLSSFGCICVLNSLGQMTQKYQIPIGPQITGISFNNQGTFNTILVSQGKNIHKICLKSQGDSKLEDSILKKHDI